MSAKETAEAILLVIKRLAKWALIAVVGLVALGLLILAGVSTYEWWKNRPYKLTEYAGVKLGASQSEVKYALGFPARVLTKTEIKPGTEAPPWTLDDEVVEKIGKGKTIDDYFIWAYGKVSPSTSILFDEKSRNVTEVECFSFDKYGCPSVFRVTTGSSEDEVIEKLGQPDKERFDEGTKIMSYPKFNVEFRLSKKEVHAITVSSTTGQ